MSKSEKINVLDRPARLGLITIKGWLKFLEDVLPVAPKAKAKFVPREDLGSGTELAAGYVLASEAANILENLWKAGAFAQYFVTPQGDNDEEKTKIQVRQLREAPTEGVIDIANILAILRSSPDRRIGISGFCNPQLTVEHTVDLIFRYRPEIAPVKQQVAMQNRRLRVDYVTMQDGVFLTYYGV